jgi:hypothetical protein|tara:strand:+ start:192 stop:854 length:663 start_codon:yes stop_codon:yes gene_type:complete
MIKFTGENSYFLPNYSRNQISNVNKIPDLVSNDFTIEVETKIDWKKNIDRIDFKTNFDLGIIAFNGMPFGILLRREGDTPIISASVWIQGEDDFLKPVYCDVKPKVLDDIIKIKMVYKKNKSLELIVNEDSSTLKLESPIADYSDAWLWVGCCSGFPFTPPEHQGNFCGEIKSIKISSETYDFLDCDFSITNGRKIFDDSEFGHHLLKRYINKDNTLVVF